MVSAVTVAERRAGRLTGACAVLVLFACAEPIKNSSADAPRRSTPVPACIYRLAPRGESQKAFLRQVPEKQVWKAVFPAFDEERSTLEENSLACTGENVFADPGFASARPRGGWPLRVQEGDVRYGSGPSRLKIAWLRTHQGEDGVEAGAVVLMRTLEDYVEVYSVGAYRGVTERTTFASERLGPDLFVTAEEAGCRGVKPNQACQSVLQVFALEKGRLNRRAAIDLERVQVVPDGERGAQGNVRYRLVTTPQFSTDGVHLLEQITATDDSGHRLRQVELERVLEPGELNPSAPPLWERIVTGAAASSPTQDKVPPESADVKNPVQSNGSTSGRGKSKTEERPRGDLVE